MWDMWWFLVGVEGIEFLIFGFGDWCFVSWVIFLNYVGVGWC